MHGRREGRRRARRARAAGPARRHPRRRPRPRSPGWRARSGSCGSCATSSPPPTSDAPVLVVSQFTLYGDARKGRRPTWNAAAPGAVSEPVYERSAPSSSGSARRVARGVLRRRHAGQPRQRRPGDAGPRRTRVAEPGQRATAPIRSSLTAIVLRAPRLDVEHLDDDLRGLRHRDPHRSAWSGSSADGSKRLLDRRTVVEGPAHLGDPVVLGVPVDAAAGVGLRVAGDQPDLADPWPPRPGRRSASGRTRRRRSARRWSGRRRRRCPARSGPGCRPSRRRWPGLARRRGPADPGGLGGAGVRLARGLLRGSRRASPPRSSRPRRSPRRPARPA